MVLEQLVAVLLGVVVLGESFNVTRVSAIAPSAAVVAMVFATVALGRLEGAVEEQIEIQAGRRTR